MTNVDPISSIRPYHPTLQDCLLARRTGIIAGPCRQPRTAKRRPAMGARWNIGSRVSWTRHSSRGSSRTSRRRRCISSFSTRTRCVRRARHVCHARAAHLPARPRSVASRPAGTRRTVRCRSLRRMARRAGGHRRLGGSTHRRRPRQAPGDRRPLPLPTCIRPGHVRTDRVE